MSQRETKAASSLQQWKGVNQRLQPTLVPDGFFADARGLFFGYGENAERLTGKRLVLKLPEAVLQMFSFRGKVIIQTLNTVQFASVADFFPQLYRATWESNGDTNGILYFIGTFQGAASWSNPITAGSIAATSTAIFSGALTNTADRITAEIIIDNFANSWAKWDFGTKTITVTDYSLRGRAGFSGDINPRNWKLQGSNDDAAWTDLDVRINDTSVGPGAATWAHLAASNPTGRWRYIRLLQNGLNAAGNNYLVIGEIEFYGYLYY